MEWLIVVAAIAIGIPAAAWLAQDSLIFFPQPIGSTAHLPGHAAPITVDAADGTRLRGWIVAGTADPAPTVIYFGGNAEEVSWTLADPRWPREWSIVALNYRGYGDERRQAGRARAHRRRPRDLRRGRGAQRSRPQSASSPSDAASAPPSPPTLPPSDPSPASCWCHPSTVSPPSAATTTPGCRSRCCCGTGSTRSTMRAGAHAPLLVIVAERTRSFRSSARARSSRRGRDRKAGRSCRRRTTTRSVRAPISGTASRAFWPQR